MDSFLPILIQCRVLTLCEVADWKLLSNSDGTNNKFFTKPANFNEDSSVRVVCNLRLPSCTWLRHWWQIILVAHWINWVG